MISPKVELQLFIPGEGTKWEFSQVESGPKSPTSIEAAHET